MKRRVTAHWVLEGQAMCGESWEGTKPICTTTLSAAWAYVDCRRCFEKVCNAMRRRGQHVPDEDYDE